MKDLKINKQGKEEVYSYQQVRDNHKENMEAGVAFAYKILLDYLKDLGTTDEFYFYCGVGNIARGVLDTVELVLGNKVEIDTDLSKGDKVDAVVGPCGGKYYFEIKSPLRNRSYKVKSEVISDEFIEVNKKAREYGENIPKELLEEVMNSRKKLEDDALALAIEDIFEIKEI